MEIRPAALSQARTAEVRLMDATEKLVAIHGEGSVSNRAIIAESGLKHNSAIEYHFVSRANLMKAVWDRGSESVNKQRKDILRYLGHNASLDQLLQAYIYPLVDHLDNQSVSYWARFNEETLRLYPMTLIPRFKETMKPYPEDNPLKPLVDVFEQIEWRTCGGQQPAAGERLSMVVRLVISTLAAWEREAEPGGGPRAAREVGEQLVPICRAVLESS